MNKYNLKLSFWLGRTNDNHWEELLSEDAIFWKNAIPLIKSREYTHDDHKITLDADWTPVLQKFKHRVKYFQDIYSDNSSPEVFQNTVEVPISIRISNQKNVNKSNSYPNLFLEYYAYEIFLVMNLSRPGSCDFFNLFLIDNDTNYQKNKIKKERIRISAYSFECSWEFSLREKFPTLAEIPLKNVIKWYNNIKIGVKQKATKPIEKALFSLYHICKLESDIVAIIWIFHALEALFSTKVGEGFSNLIDRISILLSLDEKQKSILKKKLRKLYDMRSSLVHGGYEVYHPMQNELLDESIDKQFEDLYTNIQFGTSVIIVSLQELIKKDFYGIDVFVNIQGKTNP